VPTRGDASLTYVTNLTRHPGSRYVNTTLGDSTPRG
jgi:hypothetical protein